MKKSIAIFTFFITSLIASAHTITPVCWNNGRASFSGTFFEKTQWIWIHINTPGRKFSNNTQDSVFETTGAGPASVSFSYTISQPSINNSTSITVKYNTTGAAHMTGGTLAVGGNASGATHACAINILPVSIASFSVSKTSIGFTAKWTTTFEMNNSFFELQGSNDGATFTTLAIVAARGNGSSNMAQDYIVTKPFVVAAGVGLMGMVLIFSIVSAQRRRKVVLIPVMLVMVLAMTTSCTKQAELKASPVVSYKLYRLIQVDKDGTKAIYPVTVSATN